VRANLKKVETIRQKKVSKKKTTPIILKRCRWF